MTPTAAYDALRIERHNTLPGVTPADIATQRDRRLTRADAKITRCPHCGVWTWRGRCTTTQIQAERGA